MANPPPEVSHGKTKAEEASKEEPASKKLRTEAVSSISTNVVSNIVTTATTAPIINSSTLNSSSSISVSFIEVK